MPTFAPGLYDPDAESRFDKIVVVPDNFTQTSAHLIPHNFVPTDSNHNSAFVSWHHPRYGVIPAAVSIKFIKKGARIEGHHNLPYHLGDTKYKEAWREINDKDWIYEAIGEASRPSGEANNNNQTAAGQERIPPMVDDEDIHRAWHAYATQVLKLSDLR